jgi:hypothetical protein
VLDFWRCRIILKVVLHKYGVKYCGAGYGMLEGSWEHDNKNLGYINNVEFVN